MSAELWSESCEFSICESAWRAPASTARPNNALLLFHQLLPWSEYLRCETFACKQTLFSRFWRLPLSLAQINKKPLLKFSGGYSVCSTIAANRDSNKLALIGHFWRPGKSPGCTCVRKQGKSTPIFQPQEFITVIKWVRLKKYGFWRMQRA